MFKKQFKKLIVNFIINNWQNLQNQELRASINQLFVSWSIRNEKNYQLSELELRISKRLNIIIFTRSAIQPKLLFFARVINIKSLHLKTIFFKAQMEINEFDDDGGFQVIEDYNISVMEAPKIKEKIIYEVSINPGKNEVDLNILENQYYDFIVHQLGNPYCSIQRTCSQFETLFKILEKKQSGYIFPAFPENNIFTFMKTKVTMAKDAQFIARRLKVIERFFNIILNNPIFNPQTCKQMKEFLSAGKEFEARTQIQNNSGQGVLTYTWNKFKNMFTLNSENKYLQTDKQIDELKIRQQFLYTKCRQLIDLIKEELMQNEKLSDLESSGKDISSYHQLVSEQDTKMNSLLEEFQRIQFNLFCENQDLTMGKKVIYRINELNKDEDNYQELKNIEQQFNSRFNKFFQEKETTYQKNQDQLKTLVKKLKEVGRMII